MGRLENQSAQPYPMVLLAHSAYHVRAAAHHRRHSHHHRQAWLLWASCRCSPCHEPPQRIEDAEEEEALDKPHMGNLKLPAHKAEQASHGDERHTEAQQLPPDELPEALAVVAQRHEIARYEEVKPHEERRVGREEMPYPWHRLGRVGRCVCPCAAIAIRLSRMVEDDEYGQEDLQVVKIVVTLCFHCVCCHIAGRFVSLSVGPCLCPSCCLPVSIIMSAYVHHAASLCRSGGLRSLYRAVRCGCLFL